MQAPEPLRDTSGDFETKPKSPVWRCILTDPEMTVVDHQRLVGLKSLLLAGSMGPLASHEKHLDVCAASRSGERSYPENSGRDPDIDPQYSWWSVSAKGIQYDKLKGPRSRIWRICAVSGREYGDLRWLQKERKRRKREMHAVRSRPSLQTRDWGWGWATRKYNRV